MGQLTERKGLNYFKARATLVACSSVILLQWLGMQMLGLGMATASQRMNKVLVLASVCCLGWVALGLGTSSRRTSVRILTRALCALLVLVALMVAFTLTFPPSDVLTRFESGNGLVVIYRDSLPLVSDSILIQKEYSVLPGIYAFQEVSVLDPAWDPAVNINSAGDTVLHWTGENHLSKVLTLVR